MILLSTLALLLIFAALVAVTQARLQASTAVVARLQGAYRDALAEQAAREKIRPLLAAAMTGQLADSSIPLDGSPVSFHEAGREVIFRIRDVGGLIDVYYAPREILNLLPLPHDALFQGRGEAIATRGSGGRYTVLEQTLARFGLSYQQRSAVVDFVTQSGSPALPNVELAPGELKESLRNLLPATPRSTTSGRALIDVRVLR